MDVEARLGMVSADADERGVEDERMLRRRRRREERRVVGGWLRALVQVVWMLEGVGGCAGVEAVGGMAVPVRSKLSDVSTDGWLVLYHGNDGESGSWLMAE